jgi:hypothetical protein
MSEDSLPVSVSRGVPPKRVQVNTGQEVTYAGHDYHEGDEFLVGEGATADTLALAGVVTITDQYAVEAWNGKEGAAIRKQGLAAVDAQHKAEGTKRTHDHGFAPFEA